MTGLDGGKVRTNIELQFQVDGGEQKEQICVRGRKDLDHPKAMHTEMVQRNFFLRGGGAGSR